MEGAEVISHLLKARQVQQAKRANNFKFADDSASADGNTQFGYAGFRIEAGVKNTYAAGFIRAAPARCEGRKPQVRGSAQHRWLHWPYRHCQNALGK